MDATATARRPTNNQDQPGSITERGLSRSRRSQSGNRDQENGGIAITVPLALKLRGFEARLVIDGADAQRCKPDQPLVNLLARAHAFLGALTGGSASNTAEVAALLMCIVPRSTACCRWPSCFPPSRKRS